MTEIVGESAEVVLRGVSKVYARDGQPVTALSAIDLDVVRGEYLALTGPSGSGKSTLLHVIGCLDQPTAGSLRSRPRCAPTWRGAPDRPRSCSR